jgi:ATP-dependent RNA helicase RhlE
MPKAIADLGKQFIHNPVRVEVTPQATTAERVEQYVCFLNQGEKQALLSLSLKKGLTSGEITCALVFTRTKHGADRVVRHLIAAGVRAAAIHGNKSQAQRTAALGAFRKGDMPVLVATDIAARGIDVSGVSHVFNFELPNVPEQYVHRIGRTARAGADGVALSLCAPDEKAYLRDIERLTGVKLAPVPLPENFTAEAARLPAPARRSPAEMEQDARREERDARGARGTRGPKPRAARTTGGRVPGGQGHDGQSRDQYIRNERIAESRRTAAPRGPVFNPLAGEEREARAHAPRQGDRRQGERGEFRRGPQGERPRGERSEHGERPVQVHRDAVRPAGGKPRGDAPKPHRKGGNKPNGSGQRRWG